MPNRYLRASYIESESINSLSWEAEATYLRLLVTVDDYGRLDANLKLLRPKLYPLRLEQVREANLERWIAECVRAGLVRRYVVQDKEYLQMMKWEQGRAKESKCPDPPPEIANICLRLRTDVYNGLPPHPIPVPTPIPRSDPGTDSDPGRSCEGLVAVMQESIGQHFRRKPGLRWSYEEESTLAGLCAERPEIREEWGAILRHRTANPKAFQRQSVKSLLNNWDAELDKLNAVKPEEQGGPAPKDKFDGELDAIARSIGL